MPPPDHSTGRALLFHGSGRGWQEIPQPFPEPGPGEIVVRVEAATLCTSDLHSLHGRRACPVPTVLGHETVGRIVAWGEGTEPRDIAGAPLPVGARVTWAVVASCGRCVRCRGGLPQKCVAGVKYGHEPFTGPAPWSGGLATWVLLSPGTALVRIPTDLPAALAAPASCATATVMHAWEVLGGPEGRRVVVTGAGLIGLSAVAVARAGGALEVVVVEPDARRRDLARAVGATAARSPQEHAAANDEFDAWLEASGQPAAWEATIARLAIGGRAALVGSVFPAPAVGFDLEGAVRRCLMIAGVHNYAPRHLAGALGWLTSRTGDDPLAGLVGRWFALGDHAAALHAAADPGTVRVGFRPG